MNKKRVSIYAAIVALVAIAAAAATKITNNNNSKTMQENTASAAPAAAVNSGDALVKINTTEGSITVRLFGDTPAHRDNFLKLAREGFYNGVLFHRVINEFMVQTGDPESKNAAPGTMLGSGGPGYTLEAEIVYPKHFHRRGALAAARQGDQVNPERRSSGSQFYIVTGKAYSEGNLQQMEQQLQMMQKKEIFNSLAQQHHDSIMTMRSNRDQAGLQDLQEELIAITEQKVAENPATLTAEQRKAYAEEGGTPHLDGQYTVFGQVESGMDVVDRIEHAATDSHDRPTSDIRILSVEILD